MSGETDQDPAGAEPGHDPPAGDPAPPEEPQKDLAGLLEQERQRSSVYEEKLKLALADFQNLSKKTQADIQNGIAAKVNEFALDFLRIYDDFGRAREALSGSEATSEGLDSILRNMDSVLKKHGIEPIDALGDGRRPRARRWHNNQGDQEGIYFSQNCYKTYTGRNFKRGTMKRHGQSYWN